MPTPEDQVTTLSSGKQLGFAEYGDPTGKPLFFHHGWPSSRYHGRTKDAAAKKLGIRLIAADRPGIGLSEFQEDRGFADWPTVLVELADHLKIDKFSVLGISGGGPYTLACAALIPERIERVGIICGAGAIGKNADMSKMVPAYRFMNFMNKHAPWSLRYVILMGDGVSRKLPIPNICRVFGAPDPDRKILEDEDLREMVVSGYHEALRNGTDGAVADGRLYIGDWGFDPSSITLPVHFWHGKKDRNIPPDMAADIMAQIPTAQTRWFEEDGHYSLPLGRGEEILQDLFTS